mmetsp:Transcript_66288/g.178378  ORF Transcript_66288/g.178378 Transcript_66288/m.178378 type:complete len:570 (-) Transcript_66288:490-2199(-)
MAQARHLFSLRAPACKGAIRHAEGRRRRRRMASGPDQVRERVVEAARAAARRREGLHPDLRTLVREDDGVAPGAPEPQPALELVEKGHHELGKCLVRPEASGRHGQSTSRGGDPSWAALDTLDGRVPDGPDELVGVTELNQQRQTIAAPSQCKRCAVEDHDGTAGSNRQAPHENTTVAAHVVHARPRNPSPRRRRRKMYTGRQGLANHLGRAARWVVHYQRHPAIAGIAVLRGEPSSLWAPKSVDPLRRSEGSRTAHCPSLGSHLGAPARRELRGGLLQGLLEGRLARGRLANRRIRLARHGPPLAAEPPPMQGEQQLRRVRRPIEVERRGRNEKVQRHGRGSFCTRHGRLSGVHDAKHLPSPQSTQHRDARATRRGRQVVRGHLQRRDDGIRAHPRHRRDDQRSEPGLADGGVGQVLARGAPAQREGQAVRRRPQRRSPTATLHRLAHEDLPATVADRQPPIRCRRRRLGTRGQGARGIEPAGARAGSQEVLPQPPLGAPGAALRGARQQRLLRRQRHPEASSAAAQAHECGAVEEADDERGQLGRELERAHGAATGLVSVGGHKGRG